MTLHRGIQGLHVWRTGRTKEHSEGDFNVYNDNITQYTITQLDT